MSPKNIGKQQTPLNATARQQTPPNANKPQYQMPAKNIGQQQTPLNANDKCHLELLINNKRQQMPPNTNIRNLLCIACSLLHVHDWTFLKKEFESSSIQLFILFCL